MLYTEREGVGVFDHNQVACDARALSFCSPLLWFYYGRILDAQETFVGTDANRIEMMNAE